MPPVRRTVAVALALAVTLTACTGGGPPEVAGDDPVLIEGREIYGSLCASCHTADGSGGRGPGLNQGRVVAAYPDVEDQIELVTNGRAAMPAFSGRLGAEEIVAVVAYTREVLSPIE